MQPKLGKLYRYTGSVVDMFTESVNPGTLSKHIDSITKGECCIILKKSLNEIYILNTTAKLGWVFYFKDEWTEVCP